ncbi:MAG: hypothetical protein S4CHLAM81_13860 [Chlamydiales bacterium]|nr:hypothetical protein [Chlamydiales bacterium]MCH9636158.1 hypothetical protein [Chlamydiales bacterium]
MGLEAPSSQKLYLMSEYYQANPAIKLRTPSSYTQYYWAIEEQIQKTTYAIPVLAAVMTVCCAKPIRKSDLFKIINSKIKATQESFERMLKSLVEKKNFILIRK